MIPKESDLKSFLESAVDSVDNELNRMLPSVQEEPSVLHKAIRHSVFAGGKRFRPALLFAVGETLGVERSRLLAIAAAIEMVHTYSLIHDDLPAMDNDELRRGLPTCHAEYGEATAILAGDVLQALAFQTIAEDESISTDKRIRIIRELAVAAGTPSGMAAGQQMDLASEGIAVSSEKLKEIHQKKTGAIIIVCAKSAALIASAENEIVASVSKFADSLGLLFQITDDLLDVTQTTAVLGKTAGKDESVDKATYPSIFGIPETRKLAEKVHREACAELTAIRRPQLLKAIADYVLVRTT